MKTALAILAFLFSLSPALADTIDGRVVGVTDGNTITLLAQGNVQVKVRLDQIDAPELGQAFGKASKKALSDMVFRKSVTVEEGARANTAGPSEQSSSMG